MDFFLSQGVDCACLLVVRAAKSEGDVAIFMPYSLGSVFSGGIRICELGVRVAVGAEFQKLCRSRVVMSL